MNKEDFRIEKDEDGIVIYDQSDDFVPGEGNIIGDDDLDMDYIREYEKRQAEKKGADTRQQRWVSVGVIAGVILFIMTVSYINFKGVLF